MFKNLRLNIVAAMACFFVLTGCPYDRAQYVGRPFSTQDWPKYVPGQSTLIKTDVADFEVVVAETGEPGTYSLKGTLDGSRGSLKSIDHLVRHKTRLFLLLTKDNVGVACIPFTPLGTDHTHKLPFSRTFVSEPFDAMIVVGRITVQG
jgi:hypothetical protein